MIVIVAILYLAGIITVIVGLNTMHTYSASKYGTGHVVGGDAYNYIIIAERGTAYIIIGCALLIIGTIMLLGVMKNRV